MNVPVDAEKHEAVTGIGLIGALERRPSAAFGGFLVLHAFVWTVLPSLLYKNLPLDVIEAMTYGREWQAGYDKLPPLPWFLAEIAYRLFGADDALYALSQVAVIVAFAFVWLTARPLIGTIGAFAAVLIIDGMNYFNTSATKFNHNVAELPLWALAGFAVFRRTPRRPVAILDLARCRPWARLVGEVFYGDPGCTARAVPAVRSGCAAAIGGPRPLDRRRRDTHYRGAESAVDFSAQRRSVRIRRDTGARGGERARSPAQSGGISQRPGRLCRPGAADCAATILAAGEAGAAHRNRCIRPTHYFGARFWSRTGAFCVFRGQRTRDAGDVGLSALDVARTAIVSIRAGSRLACPVRSACRGCGPSYP